MLVYPMIWWIAGDVGYGWVDALGDVGFGTRAEWKSPARSGLAAASPIWEKR